MTLLSPTEWVLMRCVWDLGSANAQQVAEHLSQRYGRSDLAPSTVGILLARLINKGYVRSSPGLVVRGRPPHVYVPLVRFDDAFRLQVERFLNDYKVDAETLTEVLKESFLIQPPRKKRRA